MFPRWHSLGSLCLPLHPPRPTLSMTQIQQDVDAPSHWHSVPSTNEIEIPEDILCEIMLHNATDLAMKLPLRASTTRACSQVCRFWRRSALGCKELWACIISYESDELTWMEELLKRSALSPLDIAGDSGQPLA